MSIYADHAATTKLDPAALEAMLPFLTESFGNASQLYALAREPKKALQKAREGIATCIGALPEDIFFTSGGTESDNWALKGSTLFRKDGSAIVTTKIEHHAVLHSCASLEQLGHPVFYLQPDTKGVISSEQLWMSMKAKPHLVSVMLANNEIGTIEPIRELARIAHAQGALFHTDAVQAVGHISVDVEELGVDMLSASAHKFNGPKGVGFLYIRKGTPLRSYLDGGAQERGLRAGTENVASIVGMAAALKHNVDALSQHQQTLLSLEQKLIDGLRILGIPFIRNGGEQKLPGLLSLSFPNTDGEALLHRLDLMGIAVSTGSACNSRDTDISHVLKAIRLDDHLARGTIRISLGKGNTEDEVVAILTALRKILK